MLTAGLAVLLFIVAVLAIPITLRFEIYSDGSRPNDINLRWAFGLVHMRIPTKESPSSFAGAMAEGKEPKRLKRRSGRGPSLLRFLRYGRLRRRLFRFVRDIWRAIEKDDIRMRARLGLGDPAQTGRMWAIVGPIAGILAGIPYASLRIEPEFVEAIFELEASGRIRVIPLDLLFLVAALAVSPTLWMAMWRMRVAT